METALAADAILRRHEIANFADITKIAINLISNQHLTMYPESNFTHFEVHQILGQNLPKKFWMKKMKKINAKTVNHKNTPTLNFREFRDDIIRFWGKIYPNEKHFWKNKYYNHNQDNKMYCSTNIHSIWRIFDFVTKSIHKTCHKIYTKQALN